MVYPCVEARPIVANGRVPFAKTNGRSIGGIVKRGPPPEFQFSSSNVNACRHPKQSRSRGKNGLASVSRTLGNVRASTLINAGTDNLVFIRNKAKSSSSSDDKSSSTSSKKKKKNGSGSSQSSVKSRKKSFRSSGEDIHFTERGDRERRQQMASTLKAMFGNPSPGLRKDSVSFSLPGFHKHNAPDARNDPYSVHKWRRKSSRSKYAGMESSPILAEKLKREADVRRRAGLDLPKVLASEQQLNYPLSDRMKKPRVPLPGVNMLPALDVHPRSDAGTSGRFEVTLQFARNAAMEELERRFHDDSWRSKRLPKRKIGQIEDHEILDTLPQYDRRHGTYRRAASLLPAAQRDRLEPVQPTPQLDSFAESPDKPVQYALEVINGQEKMNVDAGEISKLTHLDMHERKKNSQTLNEDALRDAVRFKIVDDSLSEETVTIVSKPTDALSPVKVLNEGLVGHASDLSAGSETSGAITNFTESMMSQAQSNPSKQTPTFHQTLEKKYPVLPDFSKSMRSETVDKDTSNLFSRLQESINRQNDQQYHKFSRRGQNSIERDGYRYSKARGRRVTLPPLEQSDQEISEKEYIAGKRKRKSYKRDIFPDEHSLSSLGNSPTRNKTFSSKASPVSRTSNSSRGAKDSITPVDSMGSQNTAGGRRRSRKWRRGSRMDSKGSPQFQKAIRHTKMVKLMRKWRAVIRTIITFNRLCHEHHIVSDDSYNIHFSASESRKAEYGTKQEVLFDVTDYKMKNQQKLSETTRRILMTASEERTQQDIRMIQTTLRNLKAVSDHSAPVQSNIAKYGYVVGFQSKRVVVLEDRRPLNFYILLAGSAVIIKKDESGNTNPISFIKRGDVFGEKELLNNECWGFSVVTVDPCEFLALDRNDYMRIFLDGGSGGMLSDPDRGAFVKNLSLFQGWPMQLLESNPNRCLFRYFKRGALLARDNEESDWIYVIKSGSCSVLKPMKVKTFSSRDIFRKLIEEATATFTANMQNKLVERIEKSTKEEHLRQLEELEEVMKAEKESVATSYQQIEIASLLKELNIELKDGPLSPVHEEDEEEDDTEEGNTYSDGVRDGTKIIPVRITDGEIDPYVASNHSNEEFRLSRVSDRGVPPRTPSPMKAAYLQTGISSPTKEESKIMFNDGNVRKPEKNRKNSPPTKITFDNEELVEKATVATDVLSAEDFLSKLDTTSALEDTGSIHVDQRKSVYVNIRKLTRGNSFGLDSILFDEQPSMALVSNGAECLLLNKKFYMDNMTEQVLKKLRDVEHPYPSDTDLLESYWRLISWKAFKERTMKGVFQRRAKVKHYMNPPKTNVY